MLKITFKPKFFTVIVNDKCTFQEYRVQFQPNYVKMYKYTCWQK